MLDSKARSLSQRHRNQYDKFYTESGWGVAWETAKREVGIPIDRLNWLPGHTVLDVGCGEGIHVEAMRQRGLRALGLDISSVAIDKAKVLYPDAEFYCSDIADWTPPCPLDAIYCRGMSWYHGQLTESGTYGVDMPYETARFFSWLKEGGYFVLQISTNFSGGITGGAVDNPLTAYLNLFLPFGDIALLCDWQGKPITTEPHAVGIFIGTKKRTSLVPLTEEEFGIAAKSLSYYTGRWDYYQQAIQFADSPRSVLELGPYKLPIFSAGDKMDRDASLLPTFVHNACNIPWPIPDKKYELFIALQVWEHLRGMQKEAFREVMRISDRAILSFPFKWDCPEDPEHHNITEETIAEWTCNVPYKSKKVIGPIDRIVYHWVF